MKCEPSFVSGAAALFTALLLHKGEFGKVVCHFVRCKPFLTITADKLVIFFAVWMIGFPAMLTESARQALGEDAKERIGKLKGSIPISIRRTTVSGALLV